MACAVVGACFFNISLLVMSRNIHACRTCKQIKPVTDFFRDTYAKDGVRTQCKVCQAQAGKSRTKGKVRQCYAVK